MISAKIWWLFFGMVGGGLLLAFWLPWLAWYFSLPPTIRCNLPPRNRPWWIP